MRALLDPATVGIINSLQLLNTLSGPLTLGVIYSRLRALPTWAQNRRSNGVDAALRISLVEGLIVSTALTPLGLWAMLGEDASVAFVLLAIPAVALGRVVAIQESLLQMAQSFRAVVQVRLFRSLQPYLGLLLVYFSNLVSLFSLAILLVSAGCLAIGVKLPQFLKGRGANSWKLAVRDVFRTDRYGWLTASDKIVSTAANYIDPLVVSIASGPASLSGYYLGVSIRGMLMALPGAAFWHQWAGAVRANEETGSDHFTSLPFMLGVWVMMIAGWSIASALTWLILCYWLTPYYQYLLEIVAAAAVAVPFGMSAMLRGRLMVKKIVGRLVYISLARIMIFSGILLALSFTATQLNAFWIACASYGAAAFECIILSIDLARTSKRWLFPFGMFIAATGPAFLLSIWPLDV